MTQRSGYSFPISTFTRNQSGNIDRENQDTFGVKEDNNKLVAFVVDGATALADITKSPRLKLDGAWVAGIVKKAVEDNFTTSTSASGLLLLANKEIAKNLKSNNINPEITSSELLPSASGSVLVFINKIINNVEIAQLGDAICLIIKRNNTVELALSIPILTEDVEAINLAVKISKNENISLKEAFLNKEVVNYIVKGRSRENNQNGDGYGAINGKESAAMYIESKQYKLDEIKTIIIMSDGMIPPQTDIQKQPRWKKISQLIKDKGPKGLYTYTNKLKLSDPKLIKYPRFKINDDATCVVIDIVDLK